MYIQIFQAGRSHIRPQAAAGGLPQVPAVLPWCGGGDAMDQGTQAPGRVQRLRQVPCRGTELAKEAPSPPEWDHQFWGQYPVRGPICQGSGDVWPLRCQFYWWTEHRVAASLETVEAVGCWQDTEAWWCFGSPEGRKIGVGCPVEIIIEFYRDKFSCIMQAQNFPCVNSTKNRTIFAKATLEKPLILFGALKFLYLNLVNDHVVGT